MTTVKNIALWVCLLLSSVVFGQNDSIQKGELKGIWIRVDDNVENPNQWKNENYDGAVIEVSDSGNVLIGVSLKVPQNAVEHGYSAGDVKWKNFKKVSPNTYSIQGLLMTRGNSEKYNVPTYIKAFIKTEEKNIIRVWTEDQSEAIGGKKQKWMRVPLY